MSNSLMTRDKSEARKKGMLAVGALGGTVLFAVAGWPIMTVAGLAGTGYLTWKWFVFRAKRGMRF